MLNYIKSECYRISHRPVLYVTTLLLSVFVVGLIVLIAMFAWDTDNASAVSAGITYAGLISSPQVFMYMAAIVSCLIYSSVHKYGDVKNTIAGGLSRVQVFAGKCITSLIAATIVMIVLLTVWIISAELILTSGGLFSIVDVLFEVLVVYLIAAANIITVQLFFELFKKEILAALAWAAVWIMLPAVLNLLGMRFEVLANIASWMPYNFLQNVVQTTTVAQGDVMGGSVNVSIISQKPDVLWYTSEGLFKCLLSGAIGVALFSLSGWLVLRRRDL